MSDVKTTESNDQLKEQDEENKELTPEELNQLSGGGGSVLKTLNGANHNQTCTFID